MSISTPLRNQRGIALLYLVVFFILLGVLASFGGRKLGSLVTLSKINDTKTALERDVQMIIAWSAKNGRLPAFADYSAGIFGTKPLDAWGRPLVFSYCSSLTKAATGGVCGITGTTITHNGQDVAFLLISGGDDAGVTSIPAASGAFSGALTGLKAEDLFRIVTLKELQEQASCFGTTQGKLRIVNNELPSACKRRNYSATIMGDGGVPRYASYTSYTYAFSGLPVGFTGSGATILGNSTTARGAYSVGVTITDKAANVVRRHYILNIMSSCY